MKQFPGLLTYTIHAVEKILIAFFFFKQEKKKIKTGQKKNKTHKPNDLGYLMVDSSLLIWDIEIFWRKGSLIISRQVKWFLSVRLGVR